MGMNGLKYDPAANPKNVVEHENARFTLLTPKMVRLEWSASGKFEDRASLAVINRRTKTVKKTVKRDGNELKIETAGIILRYTGNGKPFTRANLEISFRNGDDAVVWRPGLKDKKNLGGTMRTLDGLDADRKVPWPGPAADGSTPGDISVKVDMPDGFLSRSGWSVFDDSHGVVVGPDAENKNRWVRARDSGESQDIYFMGYGSDYKGCLRDVAGVFGHQVLPPKYALGYWYCRYWAYTDVEVEEIVSRFDESGIPLDVFIIDMDWHLPGWTGYTWDSRFFPAPEATLKKLHDRRLKVALNLHPADGVGPHEEAYKAVCRDIGVDPAKGKAIPFDCTDPKYMAAYFKHLHHPKEDIGVDFWWIDWQQGESTKIEGLDPLPWLNQLHWEAQEKRRSKRRPLNFSRYGGPGAGRYPVGFSGDTYITWDSLEYQTYFTPTASNALYGYWSHDIGGHMGGSFTPEMYVRWMQFGAFSPILRTHSTKSLDTDRRPWAFDEPYDRLITGAIHQRYELVPYIYSEMASGMATGVSLLRPMYYELPDVDDAYKAHHQYYFGGKMIVSPIANPVDPATESVIHKTWLPEGRWFDTAIGMEVEGGDWYEDRYLLSEIPVFVRPGTVIPGQFQARRTGDGSVRSILITAYPGAGGEYTMYEDDGSSVAYLDGESASFRITNTIEKDQQTIKMFPVKGSYKGMAKKRNLRIRIPLAAPPVRVRISGETVSFDPDGGNRTWMYDAYNEQVIINAGAFEISKGIIASILHARREEGRRISGFKGLAARLKRICALNGIAIPVHSIAKNERIGVDVGQAYRRIDLDPATYSEEMTRLKKIIPNLAKELGALVAPTRKVSREGQAEMLVKAREMAKQIVKQYADR